MIILCQVVRTEPVGQLCSIYPDSYVRACAVVIKIFKSGKAK